MNKTYYTAEDLDSILGSGDGSGDPSAATMGAVPTDYVSPKFLTFQVIYKLHIQYHDVILVLSYTALY